MLTALSSQLYPASMSSIGSPNLSICALIATYGRVELLHKMLVSFSESLRFLRSHKDFQNIQFSLKICVNGEDPDSLKYLQDFKKQAGFPVSILPLERKLTPAEARNKLLLECKSDWIVFLDDDILLSTRFLQTLASLIGAHPLVDVWGGPNVTDPESQRFQLENGWLLSQALVTGPVSQRYKYSGPSLQPGRQYNLMLCNLAVRRSCLQGLLFKPVFKTAEENEILYRLKANGARMMASDLLFVYHERRMNHRHFLKQIFFYGYGRGQLFVEYSVWQQGLFFLFPILFAVACLYALVEPQVLLVYGVLAGSYLDLKYFIAFRRMSFLVFAAPLLVPTLYFAGIMSSLAKSTQLRFLHLVTNSRA